MAKRYDAFTKLYEGSRIAFLLAEVVTNGKGEMVDLVCRYVNDAAAALLDRPANVLGGRRFCQTLSSEQLRPLSPVCEVAFSGSARSFDYNTALGRHLVVHCYQIQYGLCACILEEQRETRAPVRSAGDLAAENLPGGCLLLSVGRGSARAMSFSPQLCTLTGYTQRVFLNRFSDHLSALVCPEDQSGLFQCLMDAARSGQKVVREFRLVCADGKTRWICLRAECLSAEAGSAVFYAVILDVDAAHRDREALAQTTRELQSLRSQLDQLLDHMPGGYCLLHLAAGKLRPEVLQISQGLIDLLGYSRAELEASAQTDSLWKIHPDDRSAALRAQEEAFRTHTPLHQSFRIQRRDGRALWLSFSFSPQPQPDGGALIYAACSDVTRERESAEELRFHSELNDLLLSRSDSVSIDYDPRTDVARFEMFSQEGQRLTRTVPGYRAALPVSPSIHPEYRDAAAAALERACSRPEKGAFVYAGNYGGQDFRWYQASYVSLADLRGNVYRVIARSEDISQRREAEARFEYLESCRDDFLRESLAFVRLDLSGDRLLDAQSDRPYLLKLLFSNSASECILNLRRSLPDEDAQARFTALFTRDLLLDAFRQGRSRFELEHRFLAEPDETPVWVRTVAEVAENTASRRTEVFLRLVDVDEEKRRDAVLSALTAQNFLFVLTVDLSTRRYRLYPPDGCVPSRVGLDFYRAALEQIDRNVLPADRKRLRSAILLPGLVKRLKKQPSCSFSFRTDGADGKPAHMSLRVSLLNHETLLITGSDVSDDLTAQRLKEHQLSDTLAAVRLRDRNKGRFLTQLSHELRTPADILADTADRALNAAGDPDQTTEALENIRQTSLYLQTLTGDILDMSQIEAGTLALHVSVFSLPSLCARIQSFFPALAGPRDLRFTCALSPDTADLYVGDSVKLRQILTNLLTNAVRFTPDGGRISLEISPLSAAAAGLQIVVSDTGCGIAPELLGRLFEPFSRVGSAGDRSTGLGLAICRSLAELMGGTIAVSSIPDVGTRFTLELPFRPAEKAQRHTVLAGKRFLLAQPDGADALRELLESAGAGADCVRSGLQALQQFVSRPAGSYAAVVLSAALPDLDGAQTAAAIRGWDKPDAKTVPLLILGEQDGFAGDANAAALSPDTPEALLDALERCVRDGHTTLSE